MTFRKVVRIDKEAFDKITKFCNDRCMIKSKLISKIIKCYLEYEEAK